MDAIRTDDAKQPPSACLGGHGLARDAEPGLYPWLSVNGPASSSHGEALRPALEVEPAPRRPRCGAGGLTSFAH